MRRARIAAVVLAITALGASTGAFAGREGTEREDARGATAGSDGQGKRARVATARLGGGTGKRVGRVRMHQRRRGGVVEVVVHARGLPAGFHGLHIHTTGRCDAPDFTTAGAHFNPTTAAHGAHAADLPSLLINGDGRGKLVAATDRFSIPDLRDADGSAVIVHVGPDNFANIPSRYGTPDQETLGTGDAGARLACGVVR